MTDYLFLRAHTIADWRKLGQTTHQAQLDRLLQHAKSYTDYVPPAEHPRDSITYIGMAVANLGLTYLLTEHETYLETLRKWVKVGISYPHWGLARKPDHDLDAAWLLFGLGLAYNWVGDKLPANELAALRDKLILQGRRLYDYAVATEGNYWGSAYWQNHNWICYGGLATAACALATEYPEAKIWFDRALDNFRTVIPLFPEDGSNYEGIVYWRYGTPWMLIPAHLFKEEAGIDLHDSEFLRNSFLYRLYLSGPNLVDTINFGDGHDRRSAHSRMMCYRLAGLYQDGHAQWLAEQFEETGEWEREGREGLIKPGLLPEAWLDFVWFDPTVEADPLDDLPLTHVMPDMGVVSARSSWGPEATVLGFKCGTPNGARGWHVGQAIDRENDWDVIKASHEHPDENSFILIRGADYLAVDEGYSKEKLTSNHSTVLVDGQGQYNAGGYNAFAGLDQSWGGRLGDWFFAPNLTYASGEAAGAYHPDLQLSQFRRQIIMAGDDLILICDDLRSSMLHDYQWLLQTDVAAEQKAANQFAFNAGATQMTVTAAASTSCRHNLHEKEITANPTSAKPDWIIRRTQHTLALSPPEPCLQTRFVVVLDLADLADEAAEVVSLACVGGTAVRITKGGQTRVAAFSEGQSRLVIPNLLSTDASWVVADLKSGEFWAGDMTNLWLNGELQCIALTPADIAFLTDRFVVKSKRANWLSLRKTAEMETLQCNNQTLITHPNPAVNLVRFHIGSGISRIT